MGNHDDYPGKMIQIILQDLQSLDIQIVGGLVQDQHVRIFHQNPEKTEAPLFTAGKLGDGRVLLPAVEKKTLAHGGGGNQTFGGPDEFRPFLDKIDDPERFIQSFVLLAEVTGNHRLPDGDGSGIRRFQTKKDTQQSGFSAAVRPDDAHPVVFQKGVGKITEQGPPFVGLGKIFDLDDLVPEAGGQRGNGHIPLLDNPVPVPQGLETLDMRLLLGGTGTGPAHHPGQILLVKSRHFPLRRQGVIQPLLTGLQILFVISLVPEDAGLVDLPDRIGHRVQKIPVMGHHQQSPLVGRQPVLQPLDHVMIQVVCRLIQDQQITGGQKSRRQGSPLFLPAGKERRIHIRITDTETQKHGPGLALGIPVFLLPGNGGHHIFQNGFIRVEDRILGQKRNLQSVPRGNLPRIRLKSPRKDRKDCGLSGTVNTDDPDPVLIVDSGCHIAENHLAAEGDADIFKSQYIHGFITFCKETRYLSCYSMDV